MRWLHATLYIKVASCELRRHDVLVGCRPKNVTDALRGRRIGHAVESPHYHANQCRTPAFVPLNGHQAQRLLQELSI